MAGEAATDTASVSEPPWPTEIRVRRSAREIAISFDNGDSFTLPAEYLRVESPSAEVQGHGVKKTILGGKRHVGILGVEPVGTYALRILFDDGHDTGLYSWRLLHRLGAEQGTLWQGYLDALEERGLSREP